MKITLESGLVGQVESLEDIENFLIQLNGEDNTFAILDKDNGHFMQTAVQGDGFLLEKQMGGLDQHFEAAPFTAIQPEPDTRPFWKRLLQPAPMAPGPFRREEIKSHFASFAGLAEEPENVEWQRKWL